MAKPTQLVCQHLENISREALERYQKIIRDYVRKRQGVYALYRRGKLYYVGLASGTYNMRLFEDLTDARSAPPRARSRSRSGWASQFRLRILPDLFGIC